MNDRKEIVEALGAELVELIERDNSLRLLQACGVEVAFGPTGWRAVVGGREISNTDIDVVIRRGLAVIRGRRDLWPTPPV
jgi:hypothetical protein